MRRRIAEVLFADAVLLLFTYFIYQDIVWRVGYAASPHAGVSGYSPSFSYSLLTQVFTMSGGAIPLAGPPALDWLQVILALLLLANGWLVYSEMKDRKRGPPPANKNSPN